MSQTGHRVRFIVGDFLNISIHGKAIAHGHCIFSREAKIQSYLIFDLENIFRVALIIASICVHSAVKYHIFVIRQTIT